MGMHTMLKNYILRRTQTTYDEFLAQKCTRVLTSNTQLQNVRRTAWCTTQVSDHSERNLRLSRLPE